jgi:AraC-like DNA-binding protein
MAMIGKTRQETAAEIREVFDERAGKARGILRRPPKEGKFAHARRVPAEKLTRWIAHYWIVSWDLRGCEPHVQETLPHPNFHLVLEAGRATVSGVYTNKFTRVLKGKGQVFGIKFQPGGFRGFSKQPASQLASKTVSTKRFFGKAIEKLAKEFARGGSEDALVKKANEFFLARVPEADPQVQVTSQLVARIFANPSINTVDDLAGETRIGKRSLQRIFKEYVGASPKWVIRRYRLHELVERFQQGRALDWAELALELGYFDQAHLINDFRKVAGYSPAQYQALAEKSQRKMIFPSAR